MTVLRPAAALALLLVPLCAQTSGHRIVPRHPTGDVAFAYDAARDRIVAVGVPVGAIVAECWEWDGAGWIAASGPQPPIEGGHRIAYDSRRRVVVLFGGRRNGQPVAETWEWDGREWRTPPTGVRPPAREQHALSYDAARGRTVLFGGTGGGGALGDTWEWDGAAWHAVTPAKAPSPRLLTAMCYDSARSRTLLFGGSPGTGSFNDLWQWDGTAWQELPFATNPGSRCAHALAYDTVRDRVVMFGGGQQPRNYDYRDTWEWDGNDWAQSSTIVHPTKRGEHGMVFVDSARCAAVLGGSESPIGPTHPDLWHWDGGTWTRVHAGTYPGGDWSPAVAYDSDRELSLVFTARELWSWDGADWQAEAPAFRPPTFTGGKLAYDSGRRRAVLFGGKDEWDALVAGTWEWDGAAWTRHTPSPSPGLRTDHGLAHDPVRGVTVLGGGRIVNGVASSDVWEWDGSTWRAITGAPPPAGIVWPSLSWDPTTSRILALAGGAAGQLTGETWLFDGNTWTLGSSTSPAGDHTALVNGRVHLFAGTPPAANAWVWNGTDWIRVASPAGGPLPPAQAMIADRHDRVVVAGWTFAGTLPSPGYLLLWSLYAPLVPASTLAWGSGCGGSNGTPRLDTTAPVIGATVPLAIAGARGSAPVAVALAMNSQALPLGGCTLRLANILAAAGGATNAHGEFVVRTAVPPDPVLRGAVVWTQAFVADPNGAGPGLAMTGAVRLVIGD